LLARRDVVLRGAFVVDVWILFPKVYIDLFETDYFRFLRYIGLSQIEVSTTARTVESDVWIRSSFYR